MDQFKNNYYHDYSSQLLHKNSEEENQLRFKNIIEHDFILALINEDPAKLKFYLNKIDIFDTINKLDLELIKYAPASIVIDYLDNSKIFAEVKRSSSYFNFLDNFIKTAFIYDRDELLDYFLKEPAFDYYLQPKLLNYSFVFNSTKILKKVLHEFPDKLLELSNNIDWYLLIFIKPFIDCSDNQAFKDKKYIFDQFIESKPIKEIINDLEKMRPTQFLQTLIDILGHSTLQDSAYAIYNYLAYTPYYDSYNNISSCRSSLAIFHVLNIIDFNISPSDYFNQSKVSFKDRTNKFIEIYKNNYFEFDQKLHKALIERNCFNNRSPIEKTFKDKHNNFFKIQPEIINLLESKKEQYLIKNNLNNKANHLTKQKI